MSPVRVTMERTLPGLFTERMLTTRSSHGSSVLALAPTHVSDILGPNAYLNSRLDTAASAAWISGLVTGCGAE